MSEKRGEKNKFLHETLRTLLFSQYLCTSIHASTTTTSASTTARYTVKPFLIVPIIGAMFADVINTAMITLFLNLL